jgi:hypothetical protein
MKRKQTITELREQLAEEINAATNRMKARILAEQDEEIRRFLMAKRNEIKRVALQLKNQKWPGE